MLDLNKFFNDIKEEQYFLIKTDVPYMPSNFPDSYPVGKDVDIITNSSNYERIKEKLILCFLSNSEYKYKIIDKCKEYKIRFLEKNKLHYQVHISGAYGDLSDYMIKECIKNKVMFNGYFVLPVKYEIIFRYFSISKKKKYHCEYIKKFRDYRDKEFYNRFGIKGIFEL